MTSPQQRATEIAVIAAATLIVVKLIAYWITGSVAMLSSLVDSSLDVLASAVNMYAVRHALEPPDAEHRFGHGKAEGLAALAQSAFITGSALFLIVEAGQRLYRPTPVEGEAIGVAVMLFAIAVTAALVLYQRRVARETGSLAVSADSLHYFGDLLGNMGVIAALVLSTRFGLYWADPLLALIVAAIILRSAWLVGRSSLNQLMDHELPDADRAEIERRARAVDGVLGVHELRTRAAGPMSFVQLHIELDGALSLERAHRLAEEVEARIADYLSGADIIIHQDPVSTPSEPS